MKKVLYLGPSEGLSVVEEILNSGFEILSPGTEITCVEKTLPQLAAILDASMKVPFPRERLEKAPLLKVFVTATTGSDHIDAAWLKQNNVPLLTLKGQTEVLRNLTPAAELSWMLLLALARKLRPAIRHVADGLWDREQFPGMMLKGRTLGLVGLGRIGGWMARYAQAFGVKVCAYDPYQKEWPKEVLNLSLDDVLRQSDFISIHVHASEETRGLMGNDEFTKIKRGAILINTSRGSIVDETALLEALDCGKLGGYGCDVVEGEPDVKETALWKFAQNHDQVLITPHIGGFSPDALGVILKFTAGRIHEHFHPRT